MKERPHRKLLAWQKGMELYVAIFTTTKVFPREEIYGVTSQMRRAALSVPSNLAEGAARSSKREFLHFLSNAEGSLSELDTQIEACQRVGYLAPPQSSTQFPRKRVLGSHRRPQTLTPRLPLILDHSIPSSLNHLPHD